MTERQPEAPALPGVTRWRKKAVVVEAMQLTHESGPRVWEWADSKPTYGTDKFVDGLAIYTLEGRMRANFGDWIIRGIKGEFYPCREDIFTATYEPAGEEKALPAPGGPLVMPADEFAALRSACRMLAKVVTGQNRAMQAARIEMAQGDARAAVQWILNSLPDVWDDPETEWDGTESANEWWDRTEGFYRAANEAGEAKAPAVPRPPVAAGPDLAALRARAEAAEAKLAEVRSAIGNFRAHYGNSSLASFKVANDLAEGIRQVLDREPLKSGSEEGADHG